MLRTVARTLARFGHEVECAPDGMTAVRLLGGSVFDAVVSDVSMPEINRIDLLRAVRTVDLDVPVVLMTGAPNLATAARAVEFGALRYLSKPVAITRRLGDVVDQAVQLCRLARVRREALHLVGDVHKFVGDRAGLEACFGHALDTLWMAYQPIVSGLEAAGSTPTRRSSATGEPTLASPVALLEGGDAPRPPARPRPVGPQGGRRRAPIRMPPSGKRSIRSSPGRRVTSTTVWTGDAALHQVEQVGAGGEIDGAGHGCGCDCVGNGFWSDVIKGLHAERLKLSVARFFCASSTASVIPA